MITHFNNVHYFSGSVTICYELEFLIPYHIFKHCRIIRGFPGLISHSSPQDISNSLISSIFKYTWMTHIVLFSAQLSLLSSRLQLPSGNIHMNVFQIHYTWLSKTKPLPSPLFWIPHFSEWYCVSHSSKTRNLRTIFTFLSTLSPYTYLPILPLNKCINGSKTGRMERPCFRIKSIRFWFWEKLKKHVGKE